MGEARRLILGGACVAAVVAIGGAAGVFLDAPDATEGIQQALDSLARGRYAEAERLAAALASRHQEPAPRAWLIVATAHQRRGDHAAAMAVYQRFLGSCGSTEIRKFVLEQIQACQDAMKPPVRRRPLRERLTDQDRQDLARVQAETSIESSDHFVVRARNPRLARLVVVEAEANLRRICRVILAGQEYPHAVDVYIWADRKEYLAHATDAPEWSGGNFSVSARDGVVKRRIDLTQRGPNGEFAVVMIDRVLPHELCHVVVHEFFGDAACPLFLHEGLAMMAEAEVANQRVELAGTAVAGKAKIGLEGLLVLTRRDIANPSVFYAESFSFTEFLHSRLTPRQFRQFLNHLKDGSTVSDALQRALYLSYAEDFMLALAGAWEDHAIAQAQFLRALRGNNGPPPAKGE